MKKEVLTYFFGFALTFGLGFALDFATALGTTFFAGALTGFIGSPQQINSPVSSQSQGLSIKITRPQSSHLYRSPFFLAKKSPSKNVANKE
jgi:hypothetical protein